MAAILPPAVQTPVRPRLGVGWDVEVREGVYDYFLKGADVLEGADAKPAQVDDGVADELAGAVVGDLAAAVGLVDGDAQCCYLVVRGEQVLVAAKAAAGVDVGVLQHQEGVG